MAKFYKAGEGAASRTKEDQELWDRAAIAAMQSLTPIYWDTIDQYDSAEEMVQCQTESAFDYADAFMAERAKRMENNQCGYQGGAEVMEWQPIETAPKDGTNVLIWKKWSVIPVVAWFDSRAQRWCACEDHYDVDGDACLKDTLSQDLITHWMPLPPPPST